MIIFSNLTHLGHLGNQMFQIASTIGIGSNGKFGHPYEFPAWVHRGINYNSYFEHPLPIYGSKPKVDIVLREPSLNYHPIENLHHDKTYDLVGYFQSEKYFENQKIVRFHFTPKVDIIDSLKTKYKDILNNSVSIHVRRGDYLVHNRHYTNLSSTAYYKNALDNISRERKIENILVFSDDIEWCKTYFRGLKNTHFIKEQNDILEMFTMSLCDNHVIANSSFSWWGAWLNPRDKIVIAPKNWFGPAYTNNGTNDTGKDIIPSRWIKV